MKHYTVPEKTFVLIKRHVDGRAFWRDVSGGNVEIKTSSVSLQELLSKLEQHGSAGSFQITSKTFV